MGKVIVIDNGYSKDWGERKQALDYYTLLALDASEKMKRYMSIIADIIADKDICDDRTKDSFEKRRTRYGAR